MWLLQKCHMSEIDVEGSRTIMSFHILTAYNMYSL